jgi:ATPase subunit of ABC transporter with duplicated ATPase domains
VCNKIIWLNNKALTYYTGNYATFCKLVENEEKIQAKQYEKQQADIAKLTDFVAVNKANKKTSKSAASKEKVSASHNRGETFGKGSHQQSILTLYFFE